MFQNIKKRTEGFTIIEVMIVLAIAALILVVVLIAVPQLQRNQRNANRRDVLGRIKTEIDNYGGNNNGAIPAANLASGATNIGTPLTAAGFFNRYLGCTQPGGVASCTVDIKDPQTGFPVGSGANGSTASVALNADPGTTPGNISYSAGRICQGETTTTTGANSRNYTFQMRLEGNAIFCLDNH